MILRLHHAQISVPACDVALARKFYLQELSLTEIEKPEALKKNGGFWMSLGELQIHVGVEENVDHRKTKSHLCFQVVDLKMWKKKLQGLGIETLDGGGIPNCERFEFRDPSGNRMEFLQLKETL